MSSPPSRHKSSFRDPAGYIFRHDDKLYRQVNQPYVSRFEAVEETGIFAQAIERGILIPTHRQLEDTPSFSEDGIILIPLELSTISYPYEWCFSQLKDAALLTLDLLKLCLEHGCTLKDASAYNVQFQNSIPIFIDTLSIDLYEEGEPWIGYKQFCQHFLAPLALASYVDPSLIRLLSVHLDGIPLSLASRILPPRSKLNFGILSHIHLHAKGQQQSAVETTRSVTISKLSQLALIDNLQKTVHNLTWKPTGTQWGDYYSDTNYSRESMDAKRTIVSQCLMGIPKQSGRCWDLGANTGAFSTLAAGAGFETVAWDMDIAAVEKAYLHEKLDPRKSDRTILPLVIDLSNPSPGLGWAHGERDSFRDRSNVDVILALALVHHLAISNNTPLPMIAQFLATLGRHLIIEFVPKEDSQVRRLLGSRKDIFADYHETGFLTSFCQYFEILSSQPIPGMLRKIYHMRVLR